MGQHSGVPRTTVRAYVRDHEAVDWSNENDLRALVTRLRALRSENEWVEFKVNNANPEEVGEYISCLSNSSALAGQEAAFALWGIRDEDHQVVGTDFRPEVTKKGNEDLKHWITRLLDPQIAFDFYSVAVDGKHVVVLRVEAAYRHPVKFQGAAYIRVGSYKKPLGRYPDYERRLWKSLDSHSFEESIAKGDLSISDVVDLLDYPSYFSLQRLPLPENRSAIIEALEGAGLVRHGLEDQWQVTNGGALLYAKDLNDFPRLARKAARVVHYHGTSRVSTKREVTTRRGYAAGFQDLIGFVADQLAKQRGDPTRDSYGRTALPSTGHPRTRGKRTDPSRPNHDRRRSDDRDLRRQACDNKSWRATPRPAPIH